MRPQDARQGNGAATMICGDLLRREPRLRLGSSKVVVESHCTGLEVLSGYLCHLFSRQMVEGALPRCCNCGLSARCSAESELLLRIAELITGVEDRLVRV